MKTINGLFGKKNWKNGFLPFSIIILLLLLVPIAVSARNHNIAEQKVNSASTEQTAQNSCNLSPQKFVSTVNEWRVAKGVAPISYSDQLQSAASARIADMVKYKYYGHENPQTKQDNGYFTRKYDPAATWWDEVLDGPNNTTTTLSDFMNSAPHYKALTDSKINYVGLVAEYLPQSWAVYSNSGELQARAGVYRSNCIVVAQLANSVGSKPASSQPVQESPNIPTKTVCVTNPAFDNLPAITTCNQE